MGTNSGRGAEWTFRHSVQVYRETRQNAYQVRYGQEDKNGDRSSLLSSVRPDDAATLSNLTSSLVLKWRVVANAGEKLSLLSQAARTSARAMEVDARSARCNHACLLALSGETDQALEEIRKLIQDDPDKRQQIAEDEDFESVVELPAFRTLLNTR